ncbi:MAG TPA: hypothetical protein VIT65_05040 [Microlunatus sp.]
MTENTATTEVVDTGVGNVSPDRELRHQVRHTLFRANEALIGEPGLTQEQQVERTETSIMLAQEALTALETLRTLLVNRDFEKFQAGRDKSQEESGHGGGGIIGFLVIGPADDSDDDDSDDDPDAELFGQD